jgi:hypothetical protein
LDPLTIYTFAFNASIIIMEPRFIWLVILELPLIKALASAHRAALIRENLFNLAARVRTLHLAALDVTKVTLALGALVRHPLELVWIELAAELTSEVGRVANVNVAALARRAVALLHQRRFESIARTTTPRVNFLFALAPVAHAHLRGFAAVGLQVVRSDLEAVCRTGRVL